MKTDERNFRSAYYEKVGCHSVEEKKSLEMLLNNKPINLLKLKQFCLRFTVPTVHRGRLWNLLLGVAPVYADLRDYVMDQRLAVYNDLLRALTVLRIVDEKTQRSKVFHAMWLLENKKLKSGFNIHGESNYFESITEVLRQLSDDQVEVYWIAKRFYVFSEEIVSDFVKLQEMTFTLMKTENKRLHQHLETNNLLLILPFEKWYGSCFAGVLSKLALIRIWDKICGGSRKIVVFVLIAMFNMLCNKLLQATELPKILEVVDGIRDNQETADHIVNKSIENWQQSKEHSEFTFNRKDN